LCFPCSEALFRVDSDGHRWTAFPYSCCTFAARNPETRGLGLSPCGLDGAGQGLTVSTMLRDTCPPCPATSHGGGRGTRTHKSFRTRVFKCVPQRPELPLLSLTDLF
jgi:hypothetical protein